MSEALARTKRAFDLIPYILEHQGIALDELASKFNISTDMLYEDLNLIFCCGLPGYTPLELIDMNFDDGFVSVTNPQILDTPRKLSKQELLRLHLGLQLCEKFAPEKLKLRILNLQAQILGLLQLSSPIEILSQTDERLLKPIVEAIDKSMILRFEYRSAHSDSEKHREVLPLGISENMSYIYLEGLEIETNSVKIFRLDRISNIAMGSVFISNPQASNVEQLSEYKLILDPSAKSFLGENSSIVLESHHSDKGYEVVIREVSENWLISEILAYGGAIKITEPKAMMEKVAQIARNRLSEG